jgi:hypothetical protein
MRVSAGKSGTLRGPQVFADQAAQTIAAHHPHAGNGDGWVRWAEWRRLSQLAVRTVRVAVVGILAQPESTDGVWT